MKNPYFNCAYRKYQSIVSKQNSDLNDSNLMTMPADPHRAPSSPSNLSPIEHRLKDDSSFYSNCDLVRGKYDSVPTSINQGPISHRQEKQTLSQMRHRIAH